MAVIAFDEAVGGDLSADAAAPVFTVDTPGLNSWTGTLETPADGVDGFQIELAAGLRVTDITAQYVDADAGSDPDVAPQISSVIFAHTFTSDTPVSAGDFSGLNPALPIVNAGPGDDLLANVSWTVTTATPAATWTLTLDVEAIPAEPEITSDGGGDTAAVNLDENLAVVTDVEATDDNDAEGAGLVYSIGGGADASLLEIDPTTGVLSFLAAPDFEAPADADSDNVYEVEVVVTDSDGLSDSQLISVTVLDVNEPPVAEANGPYLINAGEALTVDASGSSDPDAGDTLTYEWDLDLDGTADFTTANPIDTIPWLDVIPVIGVGNHTIGLRVVDSGGLDDTDTAGLDIVNPFVYRAESDGVDDAYTLIVEGANLEVRDTDSGTLLSYVPLAQVTSIVITGSNDADELTMDYSGGAIPVPVRFDALDPTASPGDMMVLRGATVETVEHVFVSETDGEVRIDFDGAGSSSTITYTGLEPILDSLVAGDRIFTFTGGAETITLGDDGAANDNVNRIDSTLGEQVDFVNPTGSLTINAGTGIDVVDLNPLDAMGAFPDLTVNGDEEADTIRLRSLPAAITAVLNGGEGNDLFQLGSIASPLDGIDGLDAIEGAIEVNGDMNEAAPEATTAVTAKPGTPDEVEVSVTLPTGDVLEVSDEENTLDRNYELTATTFQRIADAVDPARGLITYDTLETLQITTGSGGDVVDVGNTAEAATTALRTGAGLDQVDLVDTGNDSLVTVDTEADDDRVAVRGSGDRSVTVVTTEDGDDELLVEGGGTGAGLEWRGGTGNDGLDLVSTGSLDVLFASGEDGDDRFGVTGTSAVTLTVLLGDSELPTPGDGRDSFDIGHRLADVPPAAGPINPATLLTGRVDDVDGDVCIDGGGGPSVDVSDGVTARQQAPFDPGDPENTQSVGQTVSVQDLLFYSDPQAPVGGEYELSASSIDKQTAPGDDSPEGTVEYAGVEAVQLRSSAFADSVDVAGTADDSLLVVLTSDGSDLVEVASTGSGSITQLSTGVLLDGAGVDDDGVTVESTGDESILRVDTTAARGEPVPPAVSSDNDSVSLWRSGSNSGVALLTGDTIDAYSDTDQVTLGRPVPLPGVPTLTGLTSVVQASSGADSDVYQVNEVFLETVVDLSGDEGNDTFNLTAAGADAGGYLQRLNDDPINPPVAPEFDTVALTRQLFLDGGANLAGSQVAVQGLTVSGSGTPSEGSVPNVASGDVVNLDAFASSLPLDLRYVITDDPGSSATGGVLATTAPATGDGPRSTVGNEVFESFLMETVNVVGGGGGDVLTLTSELPFDLEQTGQLVRFDGGPGVDRAEVLGGDGEDLVTVGPFGDDLEPIEIQNVAFLRVDGEAGDDQLVNRTAALSILDGGPGGDAQAGGSESDVLTGGSETDFLFGGDGNDILFSDQAFGDGTIQPAGGELLNGGDQTGAPPGDICIQVGADTVVNCEAIGDGGAEKGVLDWLRAILIDPGEVTLEPLSAHFDPFEPIHDPPAPLLEVTEPSSLAVPPSPLPVTESGSGEGEGIITDVNRDGAVTAGDALLVINALNRLGGSVGEGESAVQGQSSRDAADVNGNGRVEALDALLVINQLARPVAAPSTFAAPSERAAEGEHSPSREPVAPPAEKVEKLGDRPQNSAGTEGAQSDWSAAVDSVFDAGEEEGEGEPIDDIWHAESVAAGRLDE